MYEIKVLSNHEFDSLQSDITRGSDISDSLGFADRHVGKAYVRYASHPDLQKYLINHEFEELEADESSHEDENGIRHKKFFKEGVVPTFTGWNPTRGTWSPIGITNIGGKEENQ